MRPEDTKMTEEEKQEVKDFFKKAGSETLIHSILFITGFVFGCFLWIGAVTGGF